MRIVDYDKTELHTHYDRARGLSDAAMSMWLDRLKAHIPSSQISEILDLGCGTGRFSMALADGFSARVLGIDPSDKMLAEACRKGRSDNVVFRRGSGEALDASDASIDLVFISSVFHHLADPARTAWEAFRVLRSGGYVVVRNSVRENIPSYPHRRFFPRFADIAEAYLPSRATMRAAFIDAGFEQIADDVIDHPVARNWAEFSDQIALKADSLIARLSDAEFKAGMTALRAHAAKADPTQLIIEDVELLVLRKPN